MKRERGIHDSLPNVTSCFGCESRCICGGHKFRQWGREKTLRGARGKMRRVDSNNGKWKLPPTSSLGIEKRPTKVGLKLAKLCPKYGWVIVVVGTMTKALSAPGQTTFLGGVIDYIQADLGLSRTTMSVLYTCATLGSSFSLPALGWAMDRFGLRYAGMLNATMMALTCIVFGNLVREFVALTVFFYLLRFLGQGGMQLIGTTLISNWWIAKRGLMQGIAGVGLSLSMTGVFPVVARLACESLGWRATFTCIGLFVGIFFLPLCSIFFLETPELYGLLPDAGGAEDPLQGSSKGGEGGQAMAAKAEVEGKTLREALRTVEFYAVTGSCSIWAFTATGNFFHLISIISLDLHRTGEGASGTDEVMASVVPHVYLTCAISSSCFTLVFGYLIDRVNPKWILTFGLLLQSLSTFLFSSARSKFTVVLSAFVFGMSNGSMNNMSGVVHAYLFGRAHLGKISGVSYSALVVGSALGPLPLGFTENLRQQTMVMYALCVPGVVMGLFIVALKMKPMVIVPRSSEKGKRNTVELQGLLEASKEEEEGEDDDEAMG